MCYGKDREGDLIKSKMFRLPFLSNLQKVNIMDNQDVLLSDLQDDLPAWKEAERVAAPGKKDISPIKGGFESTLEERFKMTLRARPSVQVVKYGHET